MFTINKYPPVKRLKTVKRKDGKGTKVEEQWWARIKYTDPQTQETKDLQRRAQSFQDAITIRDALIAKIEETRGGIVGNEDKTFNQLADLCEKTYLKEAVYHDGEKIEGIRALGSARSQLKTLRAYFGNMRLETLGYEAVNAFRLARLKQPDQRVKDRTKAGKRKTASVNRELSALRRMLTEARRKKWMVHNPFKDGPSLINNSAEKERTRILTPAEEKRLLQACTEKRGHLRAIIVCALDTGMRQGEILSLRWRDVDLVKGEINIDSFNTKTMKSRSLMMTTRLRQEFEAVKERRPHHPDNLIFGLRDVSTSFTNARKDAKLEEVRFHDLRHTAATRLVQRHMPFPEVARILGHTKFSEQTFRYCNMNADTARRAATAMDEFLANAEAEAAGAEEVEETASVN